VSDVLRFERPSDEVIRAFLHRLDGAFDTAVCRNHDHRGIIFPLAQLSQHIHAAYAGHHIIEKNKIRSGRFESFEGLGAVIGGLDGISVTGQHLF
jgi:hypothetical protein